MLCAGAGLSMGQGAAAPPSLADVSRPMLVVNAQSGAVIASRAATNRWYPASTTKIMTAYVVFEALRRGTLRLNQRLRISEYANSRPPSKMGFGAGATVTVNDALKMLIVKSANDIAVALAEAVAGSEAAFVAQMNRTATRLGMNDTRFINPHGLPGTGQYTTARDLAVLARAVIRDFPDHLELFAIRAIRFEDRVLESFNLLLDRYPGATGMKTGFICASGFNIVASARRGNTHIVAVVLGADDARERARNAEKLMDLGFRRSRGTTTHVDNMKAVAPPPPPDMRAHICSKAMRARRRQERPERAALVFPPRSPGASKFAGLSAFYQANRQYFAERFSRLPVRVFARRAARDVKTGHNTGR